MADEEDFCEGCGVRDTGANFSHPGLCQRCNASIQGMSPDELLKGDKARLLFGHACCARADIAWLRLFSRSQGSLTSTLVSNSTTKQGSFSSWRDDFEEVEIRLPLPPDVTKRTISVQVRHTCPRAVRRPERTPRPVGGL
eukprot:1042641-Prymnesium_polylepis.1